MDKIVRLIKLPSTVRGMTVTDSDGNYNIYINKNLSYEMQREAYQHEMAHIEEDDFSSNSSVAVLENRIKYKIKRKDDWNGKHFKGNFNRS